MWAVLDYTETRCIERELLLVKVSILGPEYVDEQLVGGPSLAPRQYRPSKMQQETALAEQFEHAADPAAPSETPAALTPTETLHLKSQNLQSINVLAAQFGGKIVDVSGNSVIVELAGKSSRMNAFLSLLKPFGILESARTGKSCMVPWSCVIELTFPLLGLMVMPRTPINVSPDDEDTLSGGGSVDATLLPPG